MSAGLREGQIAELVDDHEVDAAELLAEAPGASTAELGLEPVHEIDGAEVHRPRVRWDTFDGLFDEPVEVLEWMMLGAQEPRTQRPHEAERPRLRCGSGG